MLYNNGQQAAGCWRLQPLLECWEGWAFRRSHQVNKIRSDLLKSHRATMIYTPDQLTSDQIRSGFVLDLSLNRTWALHCGHLFGDPFLDLV